MTRFYPINSFPLYLVCSDGYVVNTVTGNILKGTKKKGGYIEVCLRDSYDRPKYILLHRLVAQAFCEGQGKGKEVNHIDGNKENNCAENLEWVKHGDNLKHAFVNGLREDDVSPKAVIATNMETGETVRFESIYRAARFFGISQGNICLCCKGVRLYANGYYWKYADNAQE